MEQQHQHSYLTRYVQPFVWSGTLDIQSLNGLIWLYLSRTFGCVIQYNNIWSVVTRSAKWWHVNICVRGFYVINEVHWRLNWIDSRTFCLAFFTADIKTFLFLVTYLPKCEFGKYVHLTVCMYVSMFVCQDGRLFNTTNNMTYLNQISHTCAAQTLIL